MIADRTTLSGQLVFHATGDTGNTRGPESQNLVADKMVSDFDDVNVKERPSFFLHLGDVIYSFGVTISFMPRIVIIRHQSLRSPAIMMEWFRRGPTPVRSQPFWRISVRPSSRVTAEAGGLSRTAQIQPGVFCTFEAPFIRLLTLYSNTLEDPGVIANNSIGNSQLDYLKAALGRVKSEGFNGAVILAHHHPAYTAGSQHGWSEQMLSQIDAACLAAGVWPHAVLSGHAHNYQRFTRHHGQAQVPYIICGNGGHGLAKLATKGSSALRTPQQLQVPSHSDKVTLENYDDQNYGYLRVVVTASQLRIEYHPASDGDAAKTPDDFVTVDLASRKLVHFSG
jgi:hypothetical protein